MPILTLILTVTTWSEYSNHGMANENKQADERMSTMMPRYSSPEYSSKASETAGINQSTHCINKIVANFNASKM